MGRYRWCSFCTHAFSEEELAEDEYGLPSCPFCGAPGMYLRAWNAVRNLFVDAPRDPLPGQRYRLVEPAARPLAAGAAAGTKDAHGEGAAAS